MRRIRGELKLNDFLGSNVVLRGFRLCLNLIFIALWSKYTRNYMNLVFAEHENGIQGAAAMFSRPRLSKLLISYTCLPILKLRLLETMYIKHDSDLYHLKDEESGYFSFFFLLYLMMDSSKSIKWPMQELSIFLQ